VFVESNGNIKHYEKRFGVISIEKGFITSDDLVNGLTIQAWEDCRNKRHRLLGEVFFDMGIMTDKQVEEVLYEIFSKVSGCENKRSTDVEKMDNL
jgi:hypothetical protein